MRYRLFFRLWFTRQDSERLGHRGTTDSTPRSNLDGAVSHGIAERAKERSERDPAAAAAFLMAGMADDQEDRGSAMIDVTRLTRTRVA